MNVEARVKRILIPIQRFKPESGANVYLGSVFGIYNNTPDDESLTICEKGICWVSHDQEIIIRFKEIEHVSLNNDKSADHISVSMKNGKIINIPVKGKSGKFSDSLEFLRFLDRVIMDIEKHPT